MNHTGLGCISLALHRAADAGASAGAARPGGRAPAGAALCRHGCGAARAAGVLPRSRCRCSAAGRFLGLRLQSASVLALLAPAKPGPRSGHRSRPLCKHEV